MTRTKDAPPDTNSRSVYRGGGWSSREPLWVRVADRGSTDRAYRSNRIGFRCALRGRQPR